MHYVRECKPKKGRGVQPNAIVIKVYNSLVFLY